MHNINVIMCTGLMEPCTGITGTMYLLCMNQSSCKITILHEIWAEKRFFTLYMIQYMLNCDFIAKIFMKYMRFNEIYKVLVPVY